MGALRYFKRAGGAATMATYGPSTKQVSTIALQSRRRKQRKIMLIQLVLKNGNCHFNPSTAPVTVSLTGQVGPTVRDIQSAIMAYGPVTAALHSGDTFGGKLNEDESGWLIHFYT